MKGAIVQSKHPVAYVAFFYLIGCSIGNVIASTVLFAHYINPQSEMAMASTWMIIATLIALTWGEK